MFRNYFPVFSSLRISLLCFCLKNKIFKKTYFISSNPHEKCKSCACSICGGKDSPEIQLFCQKCKNYFHMDCVSPALEDIPEEDWYCSGCKDVDITDLKYEPGDFDVEADNGKT